MENDSGLQTRVTEIEEFLLSNRPLLQAAQRELRELGKVRQRELEARKKGKPVALVPVNRNHDRSIQECIQQLRRRWPQEEQLRIRVAEMYFHPSLQRKRQPLKPGEVPAHLIRPVLIEFLHQAPPDDLVARATARLDHIFRNLLGNWEDEAHLACRSFGKPAEPDAYDCLDLLLSAGAKAVDVFERLADGSFDYGPLKKLTAIETSVYKEVNMGTHWPAILGHLCVHGRLTYEVFKKAVQKMPGALEWMSPGRLAVVRGMPPSQYPEQDRKWRARAVPPHEASVLVRYGNQLARELTENLNEENLSLLLHMRDDGAWLEGSWCLVEAAKLFERLRPQAPTYNTLPYPPCTLEMAIVHLAQGKSSEHETAEERRAAAAQLRQFHPATLKALLPLCPRQYPLLLQALRWESAIPLVEAVYRLAELEKADGGLRSSHPLSSKLVKPLTEIAALRQLMEDAGSERSREILTLLIERCPPAEDIATQVAAIGGLNAAQVLAAIDSRSQTAVRALGLLPVTKESDVLKRYQVLMEFAEASRQQKPAQRDSELVAVDTALLYLAQSAGYQDTRRMQAAMEAASAEAQDLAGKRWKLKNSEMRIAMTDDGPAPRFLVEGKQVKSPPAVFQATNALVEMRDLLETCRNHHNRLRAWFEEMMCSGESFTLDEDELRHYQRSPIAMALLERLVIAADSGHFGVLNEAGFTDERGRVLEIGGSALHIAHPYALQHDGRLAAWQESIVQRGRIQPFDQVFREFYVPSHKERAGLQTERFSDFEVTAAPAVNLLEQCGWQVKRSDVVEISKIDRRLLVAAVWDSDEANDLLNADAGPKIVNEPIAMQAVSFYRIPSADTDWARNQNVMRLSDVPPLFFSEVMRDIGWVVAETCEDGFEELAETRQRRMAAVAAIAAVMKIPGVRMQGEMLNVRGQHAIYQIDADGEILSGKKKKISIPKGSRAEEKAIFVPFLNTEKDKDEIAVVQEIVNAARLLARDDRVIGKSYRGSR